MLPRAASTNRSSGFTLLEIVIVIALMAGLYTLVSFSFGGDNAVGKVGRLSADVRAAYDMAVLSGRPHRLVFELGSGTYWLETTDRKRVLLGDQKIDRDVQSEEEDTERLELLERFKEYESLAGETHTVTGEKEVEVPPDSPLLSAKEALLPPEWRIIKSPEWKIRNLGDELLIQQMQTEHLNTPIVRGTDDPETRAMLYFLPEGYVEKAYFVLYYNNNGQIDENKSPYTVVTQPREGIALVLDGKEEIDLEEKN